MTDDRLRLSALFGRNGWSHTRQFANSTEDPSWEIVRFKLEDCLNVIHCAIQQLEVDHPVPGSMYAQECSVGTFGVPGWADGQSNWKHLFQG